MIQATIRLEEADHSWASSRPGLSFNAVISALVRQAREQGWTVERQPAARVSADEHL